MSIVIVAKIYFQKVCLHGAQWDEVLKDELADGWQNYLKILGEIKQICIPRYLFQNMKGNVANIALHGFCDSSMQAYCAVVYAVAESGDGYFPRIVTAKTKVAPIKKLSIPRLELLSCLLLAELMSKLCQY